MCIRDRTKDAFGTDETLKEKAAEARTKFCAAMDDDLNTPEMCIRDSRALIIRFFPAQRRTPAVHYTSRH